MYVALDSKIIIGQFNEKHNSFLSANKFLFWKWNSCQVFSNKIEKNVHGSNTKIPKLVDNKNPFDWNR